MDSSFAFRWERRRYLFLPAAQDPKFLTSDRVILLVITFRTVCGNLQTLEHTCVGRIQLNNFPLQHIARNARLRIRRWMNTVSCQVEEDLVVLVLERAISTNLSAVNPVSPQISHHLQPSFFSGLIGSV